MIHDNGDDSLRNNAKYYLRAGRWGGGRGVDSELA